MFYYYAITVLVSHVLSFLICRAGKLKVSIFLVPLVPWFIADGVSEITYHYYKNSDLGLGLSFFLTALTAVLYVILYLLMILLVHRVKFLKGLLVWFVSIMITSFSVLVLYEAIFRLFT